MKKLLIALCLSALATTANAGGWGYGGGSGGSTGGGGVPYTGAVADVNLGTHILVAPNVAGSTVPGGSLMLQSTTDATKGTITAVGLILDGTTFANTLNVGKTTTGVTDLLINPAVKASGNLVDLQVAGASKFSVSSAGVGSAAISFSAPTHTAPNNSSMAVGGQNFNSNNNYAVKIAGGTNTQTTGSGGAVQIIPVYNQTGATSIANTDLQVNRTETSLGTTPSAQRLLDLQVATASKFNVTNKGHINANGTAPALTVCGTSPTIQVGSNDHAGTFTVGATGTGCVATFGTAYAGTPTCVVSARTVANLSAYSLSALALTVVGVAGIYDYNCTGLNE
jgi:hypothetical protein